VQLITKGEHLVLSVQNSGEPVSPAIRQWINAEPGENEITGKPSGTGFGLLIIKKVVQLHDFAFKVTSAAEGDNNFTLRMPRHAFVHQAG
jgi:sensor histidine kinase regulating citrate/malate metabolism